MNDSIRRIVMLCTILTFGLILIFFDVTFIQLLSMMVVLVIVLPFLLGIATVGEVRTVLAGTRKTGIFRRLDEMKFFEKSSPAKDQKAPQKTEKVPPKPDAVKTPGKTGGIGAHLKSIASSFGSLGTILKEKSKREKKVEDINTMLDKTVSEKVVKGPAPSDTSATGSGGTPPPVSGGAGGMPAAGADEDPFLSLSGDEFDAGLLDGLDDDSPPEMPAEIKPEGPVSGSAPELPVPELSIPSPDTTGEPGAAPAGAGGGLDEFSGLDGSGGLDGEFGDLDNLSLDGIEADEETGGAAAMAPPEAPAEESPPAPAAAVPGTESTVVKTAWIPSDAPSADITEDSIGIQSDMASFAGGATASDEDLLSSIASDVKTVRKEKDLSLLRELKDFKAPAVEIEDELKGMYQQIGGASKQKDKNPPPSNEIE